MPVATDASAVWTGPSLFRALHERTDWNLSSDVLVAEAVRRGEGTLTRAGALRVMTGAFTGRSPQDKFTVRREPSEQHIDWSSRFNLPIDPEPAERLVDRFVAGACRLPRLYGFQGFIGRGPHRVPVALITEFAWHNLMARHLYVRPTAAELAEHRPEFTLLYTPTQVADPTVDGTHSDTVILCDLERQLGIIGGTEYGGEEKKFFFYLMNYLLPLQGVFPMHCSANVGSGRDVSVIFGLSGTGKTTLSADPDRLLIGDDEHGWSSSGVFNFEGGCYAKAIRLSREGEPIIWDAVNRPHSILENVWVEDGEPDFSAGSIENTRGAYPLDAVEAIEPSGVAGHPSTVVFLTFDSTGTLPPVSVLDEEQALYWFLAGYTAKVAGTERGLGTKPEPTFSTCFGAPFMAWHPRRYVELLREYLRLHKPLVILMNTGCVGAPYELGGRRPPIAATRAMLRGAQSGALRNVPKHRHPHFGVWVPAECPGVPAELLDPQRAWSTSEVSYEESASALAAAFRQNVTDRYAGSLPVEILSAGPA